MDRETIRDYLDRTEMNEAQAEALSHVFAEMATKGDLRIQVERLAGRMEALDERLTGRMQALEEKLGGQMAHLKADLTWRMIAIVGFFATVITLLNAFID